MSHGKFGHMTLQIKQMCQTTYKHWEIDIACFNTSGLKVYYRIHIFTMDQSNIGKAYEYIWL